MKTESKQLGFILGRDTALSVAEIFAYLERLGATALPSIQAGEVLVITLPNIEEAAKISINDLGGTIKIFDIIGEYESADEIVTSLISSISSDPEKRINFGVSGYGNVNKNFVLKVGYDIKNKLAEMDRNSRFVTSKTADLSSVIVNENNLIERGFEAVVIKNGNRYLLGKTMAVQDYKAYSKRDFGRPKRDARNGMLPPKLAQIMINLAAKPVGATIYDPFCGSGTIIQEALFLGYRDIYASDIENKNIEDSNANIEWLFRSFGMPRLDEEHLFTSDVLSPAKAIAADAIVGEGFLGAPVRKHKSQAVTEAQKLGQFYIKALTNLQKQLREDGTIVLAIPFFIIEKEYIYLPILDDIERLGFDRYTFIPDELNIRMYGRGNLTYSRADQFVGREILVLKKSA